MTLAALARQFAAKQVGLQPVTAGGKNATISLVNVPNYVLLQCKSHASTSDGACSRSASRPRGSSGRSGLAILPQVTAVVYRSARAPKFRHTSGMRKWCGGNFVADHARVWAKHQTISDPGHVDAAKRLRRKHFNVAQP